MPNSTDSITPAAVAKIENTLQKGVRDGIDHRHRKGIATHYMKNGKFYERRPDGTVQEVLLK